MGDGTMFVNPEKSWKEGHAGDGRDYQSHMTAYPENRVERQELEDRLDDLYYKLGKEYYHGAFEDPLPQLIPLFDKITGTRQELKSFTEQIEKVKKEFCSACGARLVPNARFCGNCGHLVQSV